MMLREHTAALLGLLTIAAIGCGPAEPLRVDTIQLGRSLNPDNSIAAHTSTFKPLDTMPVSVLTPDKGRGTISVKWTYAGRLVSNRRKRSPTRVRAATEFHIQNSSGFPPGDYSVEVFLDGTSVGKRDYRIQSNANQCSLAH